MHNCIFEHVSLYIKRVTSGDAAQRDHSGDGSQESHPAGQQGSKFLDAVASLVLTHVSNCQADRLTKSQALSLAVTCFHLLVDVILRF